MSVYQRGKRWWYYITLPNGDRRRKPCPKRVITQDQAEAYEKQLRRKLKKTPDKSHLQDEGTVKAVFDQALFEHYRPLASYKVTCSYCKAIVEAFGEATHISEITPRFISKVQAKWRDQGAKPGTINRRMTILSKVLNLAEEWGILDRAPKTRKVKDPRKPARMLSQAEERNLLESTQNDTLFQSLVIVCLDTGARLSEALNVQMRDFDPVKGSLVLIHTKTDDPRTVPLTDRAAFVLQNLAEGLKEDALLFQGMTARQAEYRWDKYRTLAGKSGQQGYTFHILRHTCASRLVQAGMDLYVVKTLLGHSSIKVTEQYAHLNPECMDGVTDILNTFGQGSNPTNIPPDSEPDNDS